MDKKPVLISVIIPVLNEQRMVESCLQKLQPLRKKGYEIIVVDGGSQDQTIALASPYAEHVLNSAPGRATQMRLGADHAAGDILLFLHIDTILPAQATEHIVNALQGRYVWGRFNVRLSGAHPMFRVIETLMNYRSRFTGIATGDQAIFIRRVVYEKVGGFPNIPLMEDIALSKRLKTQSPPACLRKAVITSSRRWEQHGIVRTILLMWWLRFAYWVGVSPITLRRWYDGKK